MKLREFLTLVALLAIGLPMAASAQFAATDAWRSFDFSNEQYIFVQGTVNGRVTDMLLDTGSQISVIDEAFAQRVGVRRGKKINLRGIGGRAKTCSARNANVSAGDLPFDLTAVALSDLSAFSLAMGRPVNVFLGAESFLNIVVDIDYPNRRIAFRTAENFEYGGSGHTVEVKALERGRYAISAAIEGGEPGWYLIDTGNASTVTVFTAFARDQGILANRALISESVSGGIGGIIREKTTSVGSFAVGDFELNDMPIDVPIASEGRQTSEKFDGLLGNEVLSRFRVILDFSRAQIHLEPGPDWDTRELSKGAAGTSIMMLDGNGVDRTVILARYY